MTHFHRKFHLVRILPILLLAAGVFPATAGQADAVQSATQTQKSTEMPSAFNHNMQTMRSQMTQLQATKDPEKRAKLLNEHMQTMQASLQMMMSGGTMKGGKMSAQGGGMMGGGAAGKSGMMGGGGMASGQMMQMMMNQMTQHQQAMKSMRCQ